MPSKPRVGIPLGIPARKLIRCASILDEVSALDFPRIIFPNVRIDRIEVRSTPPVRHFAIDTSSNIVIIAGARYSSLPSNRSIPNKSIAMAATVTVDARSTPKTYFILTSCRAKKPASRGRCEHENFLCVFSVRSHSISNWRPAVVGDAKNLRKELERLQI